MTTYNHLFAITFSVRSKSAKWDEVTPAEVWSGFIDRFKELSRCDDATIIEAAGYLDDTYEEDDT